ncbi:Uncharacterised protein [Aggregatibacter aphrophilus]|uniref:Uncharacterized protein n=1 Tax=Aggregatibacter aphrophilus TaxID=732 RepID=A0A336NAC0_AGGAP|nr:Uncharacterised protein [Aggregatibacter aphrophilus]
MLYGRANKEQVMIKFSEFVQQTTNKKLEKLSDHAIYVQLLNYVKTLAANKEKIRLNVRFTTFLRNF